jgi:hypothetical protein
LIIHFCIPGHMYSGVIVEGCIVLVYKKLQKDSVPQQERKKDSLVARDVKCRVWRSM